MYNYGNNPVCHQSVCEVVKATVCPKVQMATLDIENSPNTELGSNENNRTVPKNVCKTHILCNFRDTKITIHVVSFILLDM